MAPAASGTLAGLPITGPLNHCGGADLNPSSQVGPIGTNTGNVLGNDAGVGRL